MNDTTRKRRLPPRATYSRKPTPSHTLKRRRLTDENDVPPPPTSPRSSPVPDKTIAPAAPSLPPAGKGEKKPHFNFFTRASASASAASTSSSSSSRRRPTTAAPKPKLTQMTIDLGQALQTTCRECGMSYHPSAPDDDALHKRFHAKSVGGVDFAPGDKAGRVVAWRADDAYVLIVDRTATAAEKRKAREVLDVVDSELGAAQITERDLWGGDDEQGRRFKVYLYVRGRKCIGLCLAERIKGAYCVLDDDDSTHTPPGGKTCSSSVSVSNTARPALLGISRIWTCSAHRRKGIAVRLLDCARETFIYGMHLEKDVVAFSQPTESGGGLARGWFRAGGRGEGGVKERWAVYVEEA